MIRSMTGFGAASTQVDGAAYTVEIRSVNNKFYKAMIRLPDELQGLEAEIDAAVSKRISRGSVVVTVRFADNSAAAAAQINTAALQLYLEKLIEVPGVAHDAARVDLGALLQLPGVIVADAGDGRLDRARPVLMDLLDQSIDKLLAMRMREGAALHGEFVKHCGRIAEHLAVVAERVPEVVVLYQERLRQRMEALLAESGAAVRDEDLLREVAVFAERSDIAEEVSRLQGHLSQFQEIIDDDRDEPAGRTLDFIAQEMLREANTIGSKCLDVDVSRRIVEIKGVIDRIKEQAQNVE